MSRVSSVNFGDAINLMESSMRKLEPKHQEFLTKMENIKSDQVREHLEGLYTKIVSQSEKIGDRLHLNEVIQYKHLVREFLDIAVKNSHQFSKQNFLDRRGRHRVYCIVKNVDRELESLTKEFLKQEVDRIGILKKLDDIRGMLLDIFM
jgi:uncharacterized protein